MTPQAKEKARELVNKMYAINGNMRLAKQCALIAVEEKLEAIDWHEFEQPNEEYDYLDELKQEIEKL